MENYQTKIIAHRGASFDAPENTLPAIQLAWKQQIHKVEIDVHLTKDHQIVVIHDANTKQTSSYSSEVKDETFADLRNLDVGAWKGKKWKNTRIPNLTEVLASIPDFGTLIIEIKCGKEIVPFLKKALQNIPVHQIEFICFNFDVICLLKKVLPQHKALWLLDLDYTEQTKKEVAHVDTYIQKAKENNLDGLNIWAGEIATKQFIQRIQEANLLVYIWSTNTLKTAQRFLDCQVDAITTDRPKWLLDKLQENEKHR
ncbi:glycerophosphodiester phosphodiesterase family protein [Flavicella sediminum]|uniref:glycerophosphodiester phosphodiesterase family protein n=1 Tax=Flavicella sediminum TaxID=2585141 RepID=UPI001121FB34|nr:glycerophosphodiester phosphodiesterase family protein [Flavicella sediminum]